MKKTAMFLAASSLMLITNVTFAYGFHPGGGSGYTASSSSYGSSSNSRGGWWGKRSTSRANPLLAFAGRNMPSEVKATGGKQFVFDPRLHMWAAYDASGVKVNQGIANGGGDYCYDVHRGCHTPGGVHRVLGKKGAECTSSKFPIRSDGTRGGAEMPYCTYFSAAGYAIHGHEGLVDANVSHGCIRVSNEAAHWVQNFLPMGATVRVLPY